MILLSICIPTYNRYNELRLSLNSITQQRTFLQTNSVEVIISDNNSTDHTKKIALEFCKKFPSKIFYYKNPKNLGPAKNLEKSLSNGRGVFLKISNDTNIFLKGSLDHMLDLIRRNIDIKTTLFFSNGIINIKESKKVRNLNEFIENISFYSTWIIGFGIFKTNLKKIESFKTVEATNLINDVLFQDITSSNRIIISNHKIINVNNPKVKSGNYNFYQVFITNYINILKSYKSKGFIKSTTIFKEKHRLFINHIVPFSIAVFITKKARFKTTNWFKIILINFVTHPVLYYGIPFFLLKKILSRLRFV